MENDKAKEKILNFLIGQIMKKNNKFNPEIVKTLLTESLEKIKNERTASSS